MAIFDFAQFAPKLRYYGDVVIVIVIVIVILYSAGTYIYIMDEKSLIL